MKKNRLLFLLFAAIFLFAFQNNTTNSAERKTSLKIQADSSFEYRSEQFADTRILRYRVPGFEELSLKQKELLYYLSQAALFGRDIIWDQNCKYNLTLRHTLEAIINTHKTDTTTNDWKKFMVYTKRIWFANGLHHHYSSDKIFPDFSETYFAELLKNTNSSSLPLNEKETVEAFTKRITTIIFDPTVAPKKVNLDAKSDLITTSATNFYEGVTQSEVQHFYATIADKSGKNLPAYGLNSKLVKENGKVGEKVWKVGGMYTQAIEKIVYWLEKASAVAENEKQKACLDLMIKYYKTGDLKVFDEYNINWVKDVDSRIDVVNGFIEVYGDPLGYKGAYESVVSIKDMEASKRINAIGKNAQWFEDNSPILPEHKKKNVTGISAKVITVVMESGDASPSTPIGINLPNSDWIREQNGSKSVNLGNIVDAYDHADGGGLVDEFFYNEEIKTRIKQYAAYADNLHTDMHEVIGHASGILNRGVEEPHKALKNYASTLEEARADLVALYYLYDQKLIDIGVMKTLDAGKAAYDDYITKGAMVQLSRVKLGSNLEEAHMRNRQLIAMWVYEKGKAENVIEKKIKDGKTFLVVNDYKKLRKLFGDLLREIQKIKSEGNYEAGKNLVENYGVNVDAMLHKEVKERYEKLHLSPYKGFINPRLVAVKQGDKIIDVKIEYPTDFTKQMLEYGKEYSLLPVKN